MSSPGKILITIISINAAINTYECVNSDRQQLQQQDLASASYETIHQLAVKYQIDNYTPAQKSLQTRPTKSLNGLWDFCLDEHKAGFSEQWHSSSLKRKCKQDNFYRMPVPSAFNDITSNTSVQNYIGWFWYQTKIDSLSLMQQANSKWYLQFENVNYLALVWIQRLPSTQAENNSTNYGRRNRELSQETFFLGSHVGGHLPFIFSIDALSKFNRFYSQDHRLTVAVSNILTKDTIPSGSMLDLSEQVGRPYEKFQPDFDFFHYAGIMGNVNLIRLNKCHFTKIYPLSSSPNSIQVCYSEECLALDKGSGAKEIMFLIQVYLDTNRRHIEPIVSTDTQSLCSILTISSYPDDSLNLDTRENWKTSDGSANKFSKLVESRFTLTQASNNRTIDLFQLKLGFPVSQDLSRIVKQFQGFGMHHEQLFSGRYMTQAAIMKDIYLLKQIGANLIRTSHYPYSNEFLDACDENGISVIAEAPAVGLNSFSDLKLQLHKQILLEMMERDSHHPSILMWSVANEPESQLVESKKYFDSLLEFARKNMTIYTANRFLTAAIAQSHKDDKIGQFLDVIMVNRYFAWYDYTSVLEAIRKPLIDSLTGWSKKHPGKPLIVSEFGADTISGLHSGTRQIFSEEYQKDLLIEHEKVFDEVFANKNESGINFIGSMIWNFADFSTHDSLLRVGGNRKGLFNRERQPKLSVESIRGIYLNRLISHQQSKVNSSFVTNSLDMLLPAALHSSKDLSR